MTGTPAYMAPEYVSRRASSERSDIFSAGLVFFELLTGQRAVAGGDIKLVLKQIADQDIRLPQECSGIFEERLEHLLYRALARDPQDRYESARQMREALDDYLEPAAPAAADDTRQSTIDFLLRRMRHKSDFPALSQSVAAINRITNSENQSIAEVSNTILKDFSLTNKILRMVNSVYYQQAGGGNITFFRRWPMSCARWSATRQSRISRKSCTESRCVSPTPSPSANRTYARRWRSLWSRWSSLPLPATCICHRRASAGRSAPGELRLVVRRWSPRFRGVTRRWLARPSSSKSKWRQLRRSQWRTAASWLQRLRQWPARPFCWPAFRT